MIYMVDHIYNDPVTEPEWHAWYAAYLAKLLHVPGIHSAQRFKAIGEMPPRFLAMYSVDSPAVYESRAYKAMGGGGSQSVRFRPAMALWTRNLFEGMERAPQVTATQRLLVLDRPVLDDELTCRIPVVWLKSAGLQMTSTYRGIAVLDATMPNERATDSHVYEPFVPFMSA